MEHLINMTPLYITHIFTFASFKYKVITLLPTDIIFILDAQSGFLSHPEPNAVTQTEIDVDPKIIDCFS